MLNKASSECGCIGHITRQGLFDNAGDIEETNLPGEEGGNRNFVGGIENGGGRPALLCGGACKPKRGEANQIGRSKVSLPIVARSSGWQGVSIRSGQARRWRSARAYRANQAAPASSHRRYSTIEWITDCG